jgi:Icc-related predicted phosphoesterase
MVDKVRLFHAVDVHGSEVVWRKWLSIPKVHKVNILLLCGDLTGKLIIPIIEESPGRYKTMVYGRWINASGEDELKKLVDKITFSGFYTHVCSQEEYDELMKNPKRVDELFRNYMKERLQRWLNMIDEKLSKDITVVMMPGNDDSFEIDELIKAHEDRVIYPLEKVVDLCFDYKMLSFEWVNPTPWDTPREASEEELWKKLEKIKDMFSGDWKEGLL